jgi:hypothetical protein
MAILLLLAQSSPHLQDNVVFVYILLGIMGIGISISFGCFVQIVSMFPPQLHPFFFFGTYSPFFIFAPVNVAVGDLCVEVDPVPGTDPKAEEWHLRWDSIWVYYVVAMAMSLAGVFCFFGIASHPKGLALFRKKDVELRDKFQKSLVGVNQVEQAPLLAMASPRSQGEADMSTLQCLGKIRLEVFSQCIVTLCSTIIAAEYIDFKPSHFADLPTILLYDYYIFASAGIVLTSWKPVRVFMSSRTLLIIALLRVAFVPLAILYSDQMVRGQPNRKTNRKTTGRGTGRASEGRPCAVCRGLLGGCSP